MVFSATFNSISVIIVAASFSGTFNSKILLSDETWADEFQ